METADVATPRERARRVLAVCLAALASVDDQDELAAGVREIGALWARSGGREDDLLAAVNAMAGEFDSPGRPRYDACGRVAVEVVRGFRQTSPDAPAEPVVVAAFEGGAGAVDAVVTVFRKAGRPEATCVTKAGRGHVFLAATSEEEVVRQCQAVVAGLPGQRIRVAVAEGVGSDGLACASQLLGIVTALDLPSGVYRRRDVLVEYAAARSPASSRALRRLIAPVMESSSLRTTLAAFIAEGGNRTSAAERLIIHRSTIDYRLSRIEQLTGHSPLTVRGLQVLTAAYVLCA